MDDSKEIIEASLTLNQDVHVGIPGSCECTTSDFASECFNSSFTSRYPSDLLRGLGCQGKAGKNERLELVSGFSDGNRQCWELLIRNIALCFRPTLPPLA